MSTLTITQVHDQSLLIKVDLIYVIKNRNFKNKERGSLSILYDKSPWQGHCNYGALALEIALDTIANF